MQASVQVQTQGSHARRSEAAFVANQSRVAAELALDDLLEVVEDLTADLHGLGERRGAGGDDEELLEGQLVASVLAAVDDVEARDGHGVRVGIAGQIRVVPPERHAFGGGAGLGCRHRNAQDSVGAECFLVRGAVHLDHLRVDALLVGHIHADQRLVLVVHG